MIQHIVTYLVDVPTIRPHKLSVATMHTQTLVLVQLQCADGIVGWGEATTIGGLSYGEESPESIKTNIDTHIAPLLVGMEASQVARAMAKVRKVIQGNRFAKCAIETALLDAQARRLNVPLSELLGGRVRDALPVAWTLASGDTQRDIAEAEKMLDLRRHRIFKLKIGLREVMDDVAHVLEIKRALGERASVRVDVNQAWSEMDAVRGIAALEAGGVDLIEQPVKASNRAALARLTQRFDVAIMADEALHGPDDALALARGDCADVYAVKITQSGGLMPALEVATVARLAGIGLYGGTMLEGGVGTAATAHLCSTFAELAWGTELFGPLLLTQEVLREPLVYRDFMLQVPTGPGLGVDIDTDKLRSMQRQ
ncbi:MULTISPECIES: muconate/chloromuconate family cycloisomerase [unclassified Janthinobacterium]|uniref:muconate/chloromuconate family cycloisomerase n=1 Tax=unclassified Janthinobacterium TaxID=2610881 RepID=UPI00160BA9CD|nr:MULTISPECIES: muconate/chloromuconate family cycloisomerase [unclassified Janthinobacterium]MBB5606636.1 muconate cycloisomerase [Janthinobacterium sp. S3T4]MBB5612314.1 muconate cycloisomerase [Janthinobacterium sp. S3M3]